VAGLQVPTAQVQHSRCSSPGNIRQDCQLSTWLDSDHWQWLNDVLPRHCSLSFSLLPTTSATNDCAFVFSRSKKKLIQSFLSCRLDYCNALLYGISGGLIQRLQSVQNAAARLVTGARRRDHITPVWSRELTSNWQWWCTSLCLASRHRTCQRTVSSLLRWNVGTSGHSSDTCTVPRTQSQIGDRSFTVAGPWLWNSLLIEIRWKDISEQRCKLGLPNFHRRLHGTIVMRSR